MPIASSDLKAYQSANMPEDDVSTSGGAINTSGLVEFTDLAASDDLEALSTSSSDTMNLTIVGRNDAGAIVSETKALNGTTAVVFSGLGVIERFMKATLATAPNGTITIRRSPGGATVATLPPGKTSVRRLFYDSSSEASATVRYEKFFWKNEHASLTLNAAKVKLTADPSSSIRIGLETSKNGTSSVSNRKTAPSGVTFVDDGVDIAVPGDTLEAGSAIGVWVEMTRGANAAPLKSTFTTELRGTST